MVASGKKVSLTSKEGQQMSKKDKREKEAENRKKTRKKSVNLKPPIIPSSASISIPQGMPNPKVMTEKA